MGHHLVRFLIMMIWIILAACTPTSELPASQDDPAPKHTPSPVTRAQFEGIRWRLSAITEDGERHLPVGGSNITILFDGSQFSGSTGCNQYSGEYSTEVETIQLGNTFVTEKECPSQAAATQEKEFLNILRRNKSFEIEGSEKEFILLHDGGALIFDPGKTTANSATRPTVDAGLAVYENPYLGIWLAYPAHWQKDTRFGRPQTGARFSGEDGYFSYTKVSYQDGTLEMVVENELGNPSGSYGSQPTIESVEIADQPGRLIWPSDDQAVEMNNQAALMLRYPEQTDSENQAAEFLVLYADQDHLGSLLQNLRFTSEISDE